MRKEMVTLIDDLDGKSEADTTVVFGLDNQSFEIDLTTKNEDKLRKALAPFLAAGRKTGPAPIRRRRSTTATASSTDTHAIRTWAKEQGLDVSDRGRVSADIRRQYEQATR